MRQVRQVDMEEEEYIEYEIKSDLRHEYINGKLIDMPGESGYNNDIAGNLLIALKPTLRKTGYSVFTHDVKLKIPNEKIYFYPDLFVTAEKPAHQQFIYHTAVLIAEVLSPATRHYDMFDKYLEYRKIPELSYYLLIEPEKKFVTFLSKDNNGEWQTDLYTDASETMLFGKLNISVSMEDLFG